MENIKIKFKNSGIILIAPTYIDDNGIKRFKESFKPYLGLIKIEMNND